MKTNEKKSQTIYLPGVEYTNIPTMGNRIEWHPSK